MMQHLATQKAETAADLLFSRQQQEQKQSERGQEFAELMERNRAADSHSDASGNAQQRAQQANQERASQEHASRQRALENERRETSRAQARTQAEETRAAERAKIEAAAEKTQAQSGDAQHIAKRSDTSSQRQTQASEQTDNDSAQHNHQDTAATTNEQSQTDADTAPSEEQMANTGNSESQTGSEIVAEDEINGSETTEQIIDDALFAGTAATTESDDLAETSEVAEEFDWLSMLDKLHGKHESSENKAKQFDENGELIKADEQPETDDNLANTDTAVVDALAEDQENAEEKVAVNAADILKGFTDAKTEQSESDAQTQVKADTEVETDDMPDAQSDNTDQESLADILAMLDQLRAEDDVSDEDLAALDKMIEDFMAKQPGLAESPLQQYDGKDWLKLDSRLLQGIMQAATGIAPETGTVDKQVASGEGDLAQRLMNADAQQVQKVAEHLAQSVMPKEVNTAENRATFVDNLKAGLEEMKAQLKNGGETNADLSQVVKDALATVDGVSQNDINSARLQQTLATTSTTLDFASHLSDPKAGLADTLKAQGAASAKENASAVTQAELNKQQQTGQMERLVNMHKPEAAQQMADKVQVMMNQKSLVADIRLDPPHLGGMKIKVDMSGEAASVNFVVQTQQAREALEQASPRLRELLEEQGIELGQSSVEQEAKQQSSADGDGKMAGGNSGTGQDDLEDDLPEAQTVNVVNGSVNGIDYFA